MILKLLFNKEGLIVLKNNNQEEMVLLSHKIIFYPVGNGDTSQIVLDNGKRILFDYRQTEKSKDCKSLEIDLDKQLKKELREAKKDYFDVVAFTHSDSDHINMSTEFFELRHADKYKGKDRIKINTLWVPAAMILETATNDEQSDEYVIWRQEARYRLRIGEGIRVFSKPDKLKTWLEENDLSVDERKHLITDAGQIAPDFSISLDGVEFFCHSPFIKMVDENAEFRNEASLVFNIRFNVDGTIFDYLEVGDCDSDILSDIVTISKKHENEDRLNWDLYNLPHHCSYKALNNEEKGERKTVPVISVEELLLHGKAGAYLVSSSNPIKNTCDAYEQTQPPHIQAKNCYKEYLENVSGTEMYVTMEYPSEEKPLPLTFIIDSDGSSVERNNADQNGVSSIISHPTPRAGCK